MTVKYHVVSSWLRCWPRFDLANSHEEFGFSYTLLAEEEPKQATKRSSLTGPPKGGVPKAPATTPKKAAPAAPAAKGKRK